MSIKSLIINSFGKAGYDIVKRDATQSGSSMHAGMKRLAMNNINPVNIIDIGAASGHWSELAMQCWPAANYHLIEPLQEQLPALSALRKVHKNVNFHIAVAGAQPGEINFNVAEDLDGSGVYDESAPNARKIPVVSIDSIVSADAGPCLIKLDTHGYELPILEGAVNTLPNTVALIIEVYGFRVSPTCPLFHEISARLFELGFRLIDVVDVMRRSKDNAFWQADAFYIRDSNSIFTDNLFA